MNRDSGASRADNREPAFHQDDSTMAPTAEDAVRRLQALAAAAGAEDLSVEAESLLDRAGAGRFYLACVGQFKRGKSSLLNALVGTSVLPTGVLPVTTIPTVLRYGALGARARGPSGWTSFPPERLADLVTEAGNPGNRAGIQMVEVRVPSPLLEPGLCLVDTPGLGSVNEASSAVTREFIPHLDAALVVVGADPPVSGEELRLVSAIAAETDTLIFALNKVDRVTATERDEATTFLQTTLARHLGRGDEPIYRVSALHGGGGPDWGTLVERLTSVAGERRNQLVGRALERGRTRLGLQLAARLTARLGALTWPIEESERRVKELHRLQESVDRALNDLRPLYGAEEARLSDLFARRAAEFARHAERQGLTSLRSAWDADHVESAPASELLELANQTARQLILPWLRESETAAEAEYEDATRRFLALANAELDRLYRASGLDGEGPAAVPPDKLRFRTPRHFAFHDRMRLHYQWSPWRRLIELLTPARLRLRRNRRRAESYLVDLVTVNASRVAGDLAERVRESRREAEAEIRTALRVTARAASEALEWARTVRARGLEEIRVEREQLEVWLREVEVLAASR